MGAQWGVDTDVEHVLGQRNHAGQVGVRLDLDARTHTRMHARTRATSRQQRALGTVAVSTVGCVSHSSSVGKNGVQHEVDVMGY